MNHDDVLLLLPELLADRLPAAERTQIEDHLARCPSCRLDLEAARLTAAVSAHATSAEIVGLALGGEAASGLASSSASIREHVARCAECSALVNEVRAAEQQATTGPRSVAAVPGRWTPRAREAGLLAAMITVAVLAFPAYQGWRTLPAVRSQLESTATENGRLRDRLEREHAAVANAAADRDAVINRSAGIFALTVLQPGERGLDDGDGPTIVVEAPLAAVGVGPPLHSLSTVRQLVVSVRHRLGGATVFSTEMSGADARRSVERTGGLLLLIPAQVLNDGRYEVVGRAIGKGAEAAPVFSFAFVVRRASSAPAPATTKAPQ